MLDMALGAHPECASVGELVHWQERNCSLCGENCEYWSRFREIVDPPRLHETACQVFQRPFIVDSSKKTDWVKANLRFVRNYKIIRLVRDGYDRLLTHKERNGVIGKDAIRKWVRREERITRMLRHLDHLVVRYEDLCDRDALEECCGFLGLDYDPSMREYWKVRHHGISGSEKAYALIRAYHDVPLNETQKRFVERHGFELKQREKVHFMNPSEQALWVRYGRPMNRRLGYNS